MESDIIEKIMAAATYIDKDGKVKQGFRNIRALWENVSPKVQRETMKEVIKALATYKDKNGRVKQGYSNVYNLWIGTWEQRDTIKEAISLLATYTYTDKRKVKHVEQGNDNIGALWFGTLPELQSEILIEAIELLATYKDENGQVKPGAANIGDLWKATSQKVQRDTIKEVMKTLATYKDENGQVQSGFANIANLWKNTLPELQSEKIMEVIQVLATYEKNVKEEVRVIQGIKNITNLWKYTSPDVQSKKFLEILDYFMNTTYKDEFNKEQVQGRNLRAFLEYTPKEIIEENYEAICKRALSFEDNSNELSRILIYALPPVQELDDETIRKINEGKLVAKINKKKLDQLDGTIDKGVPICLEIKDVSELTVEQIEQLRNEGINIQYVGMEKQRLNTEQYIPYNIERYRKIRTKIDELLCNVNKNENKC